MDFKETKTKIQDFLGGKGFYLVLAACLVATGVAAAAAYAGVNDELGKTKENGSSLIESSGNNSSSQVQLDTKEPYTPPADTESSDTESIVADSFVYPFSGNILKGFSDTNLVYSETFGDMRVHTGVDLAADLGLTVGACGNGVVQDILNDPLWGFVVRVDHGNGIIAAYCGLGEDLLVSVGDIVSAGSPLGYLSTIPCECKDAAHLHLEFYKDGKAVNPENVI